MQDALDGDRGRRLACFERLIVPSYERCPKKEDDTSSEKGGEGNGKRGASRIVKSGGKHKKGENRHPFKGERRPHEKIANPQGGGEMAK